MELTCRAILFDNDGVLVDSHEQVEQAWGRIARETGLALDEIAGGVAGVRAVDVLEPRLPREDVAAALARLEDLEVELADSTHPVRGAIGLLGALPSQRWAVVTSASRRLAEARWRGAGLPFPAASVAADDVTQGKPYPEPYLRGAELLGVDPSDCVVFEDSPSGGLAASAAGATVVAIGRQPWNVEPVARLEDLTAVEIARAVGGSPLVLRLRTTGPSTSESAVTGLRG